jgi:ribonucleases P/MRP protein subunit RPP40
MDKDKLENVQRRATRIEPLRGKNYEERRRILNLPLLEERRRRGDLIEMFKIINSNGYTNFLEPLKFFDNMSRSRHSKRIHRELVKNTCRYHYFANRVIDDWNSLSQDAIDKTNFQRLLYYFGSSHQFKTVDRGRSR